MNPGFKTWLIFLDGIFMLLSSAALAVLLLPTTEYSQATLEFLGFSVDRDHFLAKFGIFGAAIVIVYWIFAFSFILLAREFGYSSTSSTTRTISDAATDVNWRPETLYYVGFIATMVSLACGFYEIGETYTVEDSPDLISTLVGKAGTALISTILGLILKRLSESYVNSNTRADDGAAGLKEGIATLSNNLAAVKGGIASLNSNIVSAAPCPAVADVGVNALSSDVATIAANTTTIAENTAQTNDAISKTNIELSALNKGLHATLTGFDQCARQCRKLAMTVGRCLKNRSAKPSSIHAGEDTPSEAGNPLRDEQTTDGQPREVVDPWPPNFPYKRYFNPYGDQLAANAEFWARRGLRSSGPPNATL
jgi:hypothetical protein